MQEINLGEELIELGSQLREIGLKYNQEYITMTYLNGLVRINNSTELPKEKRIDLKITEDVAREEDKEIEKIEFNEIDEMTDYDIYSYPECEDDSKENFKNKINELIKNQKKIIKAVNELKKEGK